MNTKYRIPANVSVLLLQVINQTIYSLDKFLSCGTLFRTLSKWNVNANLTKMARGKFKIVLMFDEVHDPMKCDNTYNCSRISNGKSTSENILLHEITKTIILREIQNKRNDRIDASFAHRCCNLGKTLR